MPSAGFTWHVCLSWFSKHLISLLSTHVEFLWEQELLFFKDQIHVVCQLCMWNAYVKWDLGWWCWLSMKGLLCCRSLRLSKVEFQVFIVTCGCCYIKTNMREDACSCPGPLLMPVICICVCVCTLSRVQFLAAPWTVARQDPRSMGFSRQEYWSGLPCPPPGDLPDPGIKLTSVSCIGRWVLYH